MKKTFEQWFAEVKAACRAKFGVCIGDLPDCPFKDWYDARMTPKGAANKAWKLSME